MLVPGQLANIDSEDRLVVPAAVLRPIEWWKKDPVTVLAELVLAGLIRIYLEEEALPMVDHLIAALDNLSAESRFERAAVLADRYRPLKLYGDGRLQITKAVAQILGYSLGERPTLFAQPFPKGFEVMSLEYRAERLLRSAESATIGLRHPGHTS